jgi:BolA protein
LTGTAIQGGVADFFDGGEAFMSVADSIRRKLEDKFSPRVIEVVDQSHLHAGHVGARPEGETHFRVVIVSAAFEGMSRLERQRAVNATLSDELMGPVHALSLRLLTPDEEG